MKKLMGLMVMAWFVLTATATDAHNVWCHCGKLQRDDAIKFFHQSGAVYETLSRDVLLQWHEANAHLENGVLAEFDHKADSKNPLKPEEFKRALAGYEVVALALDALDGEIAKLQEIDKAGASDKTYEDALTKILRESSLIERVSARSRYGNLGTPKSEKAEIPEVLIGTAGILAAQRKDLSIVRSSIKDVLKGFHDVIPLAEKGEFAKVMLSGRNSFGDKMPLFTDQMSTFERMYIKTCMATIATTMQSYPKGFEWLSK